MSAARARVAVHEAGHAVATVRLGFALEVVQIEPEPLCRYGYPGDRGLEATARFGRAASTLAGPAAERLVLDNASARGGIVMPLS